MPLYSLTCGLGLLDLKLCHWPVHLRRTDAKDQNSHQGCMSTDVFMCSDVKLLLRMQDW